MTRYSHQLVAVLQGQAVVLYPAVHYNRLLLAKDTGACTLVVQQQRSCHHDDVRPDYPLLTGSAVLLPRRCCTSRLALVAMPPRFPFGPPRPPLAGMLPSTLAVLCRRPEM